MKIAMPSRAATQIVVFIYFMLYLRVGIMRRRFIPVIYQGLTYLRVQVADQKLSWEVKPKKFLPPFRSFS